MHWALWLCFSILAYLWCIKLNTAPSCLVLDLVLGCNETTSLNKNDLSTNNIIFKV